MLAKQQVETMLEPFRHEPVVAVGEVSPATRAKHGHQLPRQQDRPGQDGQQAPALAGSGAAQVPPGGPTDRRVEGDRHKVSSLKRLGKHNLRGSTEDLLTPPAGQKFRRRSKMCWFKITAPSPIMVANALAHHAGLLCLVIISTVMSIIPLP